MNIFLTVPFRIRPLPVWPEPCQYYLSLSEDPGLFLSVQPTVCPYPLTVPTGFQSAESWTRTEKPKKWCYMDAVNTRT